MLDRHKVLLVEDDVDVRLLFRDFLETKGFVVHEADSSRSAQRLFQVLRPDVTVADYELPDGNALELVRRFKAIDPALPVVIVTGFGSLDLAVRAGQHGADRFLAKPVDLPDLHRVVESVLESPSLRGREAAVFEQKTHPDPHPFLGASASIRKLETMVERVLATSNPVLIQGETGTGKGVLARWVHSHGPRSANAFVDINCAGLSGELLDTELFGHERGAFTGAARSKTGLLEVANGGTVFLDEISDMQLSIQGELLKVLEEKSFRKLGGVHDRHVDIRLVAASNRDLRKLIREERFRSDLYYRLSVFPIRIPPLRERIEDVPALARDIAGRLGAELGRSIELTPAALSTLQGHQWPGNIRELKNVLERTILLSDDPVIDRSDLALDGEPFSDNPNVTLREIERLHISRVLEEEDGRVARAATRLGIPKSSLYQKMRKLHAARANGTSAVKG